MVLSEVEKVEKWKQRCMDAVANFAGDENSLLCALQKIKESLDRSLYVYENSQGCEGLCLCMCCTNGYEDWDFLTCSTCKDRYHLQCVGYRNHAEEVYVCSYCQLLVGGSIPHNGSGFLRHNAKYLDVKLLFELLQGPLDHKPEEKIAGNALFRWQSNVDDPHTFMDLFVSNADLVLQMRSCAYNPRYGFGAFGILPLLLKKRVSAEDYGVMRLRYGSGKLSAGVTVMPFAIKDELPKSAWLVSKMGRLTVGV